MSFAVNKGFSGGAAHLSAGAFGVANMENECSLISHNRSVIILVGTPLGHDADASDRMKHTLEQVDLIAAEDTRRFLNLAGRLNISLRAPLTAYHDHNEAQKAPELVRVAAEGKRVAVVTDAGMPAISDPGYRLVALAVQEGVPVTVVPGPSAVVTALALSGLPSDRFTFEGFLPRKSGEQSSRLAQLAREVRTMVFYESPRRVGQTLARMEEVFGEGRQAAVARELTKTHEQVRRGSLGELAQWAAQEEIRGEIVIVVRGAPEGEGGSVSPELIEEARQLRDAGLRLKAAAAYIARREHVSATELYNAAV